MPADPQTTGEKFERLVAIMARLRRRAGCPWDRERKADMIKPYLLEETYEVLEAIDKRDWPALADELGDLLLQAVFFAQMAAEENKFRIDDSIDAIVQKLIRRHPHVFADGSAKTSDDVKLRWDEIKADEKKSKGEPVRGLLESVPRNLPALVEAQQIASKAAGVGFDWENADQVLDKLDEELDEPWPSARRWIARRAGRRDRRSAVCAGESGALRKSRPRTSLAQNECEVS